MTTPALRRLAAGLVAVGGILFAVGNLLHPLEHSHAAHQAATWEAAHLTFGFAELLICAGLPLLMAVGGLVRPSRLAVGGAVALGVASAALAPGAWFEAYVAPLPGGVGEQLEAGPGGTVNTVAGVAWLVATLALGAGLAWRGARRPIRLAGATLLAVVATLLVGPAFPGREGLWIIPATVAAGLALVVLAVEATRMVAPDPAHAAATRQPAGV
jgi:hypothetical protein